MVSSKSYCLILGLGLLLSAKNANAQTFAEWFRQKSTQKKYLLQQIEALQVYSTYLRKGYQVAKGGLGTITGELMYEQGLHRTYYNKLAKVDPLVANNEQVKEIISWQHDIMLLLSGLDKLPKLSVAEKRYLAAVRSNVYHDCEGLINTLEQVVTDNKMQMSDADRLKLIQKLHVEMEDNYRFAAMFTAHAKNYAKQLQQEKHNSISLKKAYGLH